MKLSIWVDACPLFGTWCMTSILADNTLNVLKCFADMPACDCWSSVLTDSFRVISKLKKVSVVRDVSVDYLLLAVFWFGILPDV